jgi:hypothetical protein
MNDARNVCRPPRMSYATIRSCCAVSSTNGRAPYRRFRAQVDRLARAPRRSQITQFGVPRLALRNARMARSFIPWGFVRGAVCKTVDLTRETCGGSDAIRCRIRCLSIKAAPVRSAARGGMRPCGRTAAAGPGIRGAAAVPVGCRLGELRARGGAR